MKSISFCHSLNIVLMFFVVFGLHACAEGEDETKGSRPASDPVGAFPNTVSSAFRVAFPEANILEIVHRTDFQRDPNGKNYYGVVALVNDTEITALYHDDGKVVFLEQAIPIEHLPSTALQNFEHSFPLAIIESIKQITQNGQRLFEVTVVDGDKKRNFLLDANGNFISDQEAIALNEIPQAVLDAVPDDVPEQMEGSRIEIEKWTFANGTVHYEVAFNESPRTVGFLVTSEGTILQQDNGTVL